MVDPGANLSVLVMTGSLASKHLNENMPVSVALWNVLVDKQPESLICLICFRLLSFDNLSKYSFSSCSGQLYCHSAALTWMIYHVHPRTLIRLLPPLLLLIVSRMLRAYLPCFRLSSSHACSESRFFFYCNHIVNIRVLVGIFLTRTTRVFLIATTLGSRLVTSYLPCFTLLSFF